MFLSRHSDACNIYFSVWSDKCNSQFFRYVACCAMELRGTTAVDTVVMLPFVPGCITMQFYVCLRVSMCYDLAGHS